MPLTALTIRVKNKEGFDLREDPLMSDRSDREVTDHIVMVKRNVLVFLETNNPKQNPLVEISVTLVGFGEKNQEISIL